MTKDKTVISKLFSARCIVLLVGVAASAWAQAPQAIPGRLLVGFRPGTPDSQADSVVQAALGRSLSKIAQIGVHVVELPANANATAIAAALRLRPEVAFVEPDMLVPPSDVTPNDPWLSTQWHLPKISALSAWTTTTGSGNVVIAIIDTGVESTHVDLSAKLISGWNIYNNNSDTRDVYGHGTLVPGAAAAITNNGLGVAGVCWRCMIMPVRVSDTTGYATFANLASGVVWAADHGAKVANVSYQVSASSTVTSAAQYFMMSKGGVVTSAAGNGGTFLTSSPNASMLTIGGSDPNDARYSWSNFGNNLDLVAPGCVFTTSVGSTFNSACGTSLSAPVVAGVAALMFSANPSLSASNAVSYLKQSADDLGASGWDSTFGWGRVNATRAVALAVNATGTGDTTAPQVTLTAPADSITVSGAVSLQASASDNVGVTSVSFAVDGVTVCSAASSPYTCSWNTGGYSNASHPVTATARDAAGNSSASSVTVLVSNAADVTPPTIVITAPANGAKVSKSVSITTSTSDNVGVVTVDLYVDSVKIATDTSAPFSFSWKTQKVAADRIRCR